MSEEEGVTADDSTHLTSVVASVVTMLTLVAAFGLLAVGWPYFWIAFPIGFGGVLPAATAIAAWYESKRKQTATVRQTGAGGKLATLREQYAEGEMDEATFERKVERLLETESIEDAKLFYGDGGPDTDDAMTGAEKPPAASGEESTKATDRDQIPDDEPA
ncbi:MAG: SHOCT domain-containing protein [Halovenus sp.]